MHLALLNQTISVGFWTIIEILLAFVVCAAGPWFPYTAGKYWALGSSAFACFFLFLLLIFGFH